MSASAEKFVSHEKFKNLEKIKMFKQLIGIVLVLLLFFDCSSVDTRLIYKKKTTVESSTIGNDVSTILTSNIINAPVKCPKGMKVDKRNICRKFV